MTTSPVKITEKLLIFKRFKGASIGMYLDKPLNGLKFVIAIFRDAFEMNIYSAFFRTKMDK